MKSRFVVICFMGILFLIAAKTEILAFSWEDDIQLHGFASQGYLKSTHNDYFGNSSSGTFNFNEVGVNLSLELTDELRFGFQLFSRNLGDYDDDLKVDWAFFDYSLYDWLGFRAGKIKMPFGLYNRQRDADMLRTSILLPQSVYTESVRDYLVAFRGGSVYGSYLLGAAGEIDYEFFGGTFQIDNDSIFVLNFFQIAGYALFENTGIDFISILESVGISYTDVDVDISHIEGGNFLWYTPLSGLRTGFSVMMGKGELSANGYEANFMIKKVYTFSAEYEIADIVFMAEYFAAEFEITLKPIADIILKMDGWYIGSSYRVTDWFEIGASYGIFYPNSDDKDGSSFKMSGKRDYYAWQKDITLSAKFNINEYLSLKMETHFIDGVGMCNDTTNSKIMKRDWMLYAVKASINF